MRSHETEHWRFEIDGTHFRVLPLDPTNEDRVHILKQEFASALVGLGIVHVATVQYTKPEEEESKTA